MFRDDRQIAAANHVLCSFVPRLRGAWTPEGPSPQALKWFEENGGPLSSGERVLLLASFSFWNGGHGADGLGKLRFTEVLDSLDGEHLRRLAELMIASAEGASAVDSWIQAWKARSV